MHKFRVKNCLTLVALSSALIAMIAGCMPTGPSEPDSSEANGTTSTNLQSQSTETEGENSLSRDTLNIEKPAKTNVTRVTTQMVKVEPKPDPVEELIKLMESELKAGRTNVAKKLVFQAVDGNEFSDRRDEVFSLGLRLLGHLQENDEIRTKYEAALTAEDEELILAGFGSVYSALMRTRAPVETIRRWVKTLLATPQLEKQIKITANWLVNTYVQENDWEGLIDEMPKLLETLDEKSGKQLVENILRSLVSRNQTNPDDIINKIEAITTKYPQIAPLITVSRVERLARSQQWNALLDDFKSAAVELEDTALSRLLRRIVPILNKAGKYDLTDAVCQYVLEDQRKKNRATQLAARYWIGTPKARNDQRAVPIRLNSLKQAGVSPESLYRLMASSFYFAIDGSSKDTLKRLLKFTEQLLPRLKEEKMINDTKTKIMECAFLVEDYNSALRILKAGIPGRDEQWQKMAIVKVKAHRALQNNKPFEAVLHFREFMKHIEQTDKPQKDPTTGAQHTREMTLARNASRIGDILMDAGDKPGATKAYEEASAYLETAMDDPIVKPGSPEEKIIKDLQAQLPKGSE